MFGFFARKTDLYTSPNVGQKPEELILQSFRKWEKVGLEKHRKEKAERDEVKMFFFLEILLFYFFHQKRLIVFDVKNYVVNVKKKKEEQQQQLVKMNYHVLLKLQMKKLKKLHEKMLKLKYKNLKYRDNQSRFFWFFSD